MKKTEAKKSNVGMTLTFTQVCVGDTIKAGVERLKVLNKSQAEHYVEVSRPDANVNRYTDLLPKRIYEFEFNQLKPILMEEA